MLVRFWFSWHVSDSNNFDKSADTVSILMSPLTAYTQYAYYVKTNTIAATAKGGQTPIQYLMTGPARPDPVIRLEAETQSESELVSYTIHGFGRYNHGIVSK